MSELQSELQVVRKPMSFRSALKVIAPFLVAGLVLAGASESASAWALTDIIPTDLKTALAAIPALFTEWSGYILSALGIMLVVGLVRKFL